MDYRLDVSDPRVAGFQLASVPLRYMEPCTTLSPRLAGFGFPLKDYAAKPGKTWLPH